MPAPDDTLKHEVFETFTIREDGKDVYAHWNASSDAASSAGNPVGWLSHMLVMNVCEGACAHTGNLEGMCGWDVCGRDEVVEYGRGHAGGTKTK